MKRFSHIEPQYREGRYTGDYFVNYKTVLEALGDKDKYHLDMMHDNGTYCVKIGITLSPKEASELRDDITQYLRRFE